MEDSIAYRHEIKHRITRGQKEELTARLRVLMKPDAYAREDGTYFIRSLYFDNPNDLVLREKAAGTARREKFRIRYYNGDLSFIRLEKKCRIDRLSYKQSAVMTAEQCRRLIAGDDTVLRADPQPLMQELYAKMKLHGLQPKTIVDYDRRTFVYPLGDTRITLDDHIRTDSRVRDFLDPACTTLACDAPEDAVCILEVKYGAFLPDFIRDAVQLDDCRSSPFSKYEISRRFG